MQLRPAGLGAERLRQHFGTETGTTHAEQQRVCETLTLDLLRECFIHGYPPETFLHAIKPSKPFVLVCVRPQRFVVLKEPPNVAPCAPLLEPPAHKLPMAPATPRSAYRCTRQAAPRVSWPLRQAPYRPRRRKAERRPQ